MVRQSLAHLLNPLEIPCQNIFPHLLAARLPVWFESSGKRAERDAGLGRTKTESEQPVLQLWHFSQSHNCIFFFPCFTSSSLLMCSGEAGGWFQPFLAFAGFLRTRSPHPRPHSALLSHISPLFATACIYTRSSEDFQVYEMASHLWCMNCKYNFMPLKNMSHVWTWTLHVSRCPPCGLCYPLWANSHYTFQTPADQLRWNTPMCRCAVVLLLQDGCRHL